ncbi:hypothetical protein [Butyrivibrio sp. LB2008]|uniref:hypothetical protein n=1 Tax=Butyrivibrio sp. LB2008 TaxID=1408305 RepID=UPI00047C92B5|nr:hypothetical protein [Butyrivibrio sp. LB2008]
MREKKLVWTLLAALMLTACGAKETTQDEGNTQDTAVAEVSSQAVEAGTEASTTASTGEALVQKIIDTAAVAPELARESLVDDFDGDGSMDAFVYIGKEVDKEMGTCEGEVWFASDKVCEKVEEEFSFVAHDGKAINVLPTENKNFILIERAFMSSSVTDVFYIAGGDCKSSAISGIGGFYKSEDTGDYCINVDNYDMSLEFESAEDADNPDVVLDYGPGLEKGLYTGHTWKEYFFYYDKDTSDFKEYASKELTEEELNSACGFDIAGEIKAAGFQLGHIYRRDNGVININYYQRTDNENGSVDISFRNATYNEKTQSFMYEGGEGEKPWQKSDCGGIFEANIF